MSVFKRTPRHSWISLLAGLPVVACLSCTGSAGTILSGSIGTILDTAEQNTVFINVANGTENSVQVTLRVDGVDKTLLACTALQGTCTYALTTCPNQIALIQEIQLDADELFVTGHTFEGDPNYVWQQGDFDCGGQILIQVSDTQVAAYPL